jgi:hypothetical protein
MLAVLLTCLYALPVSNNVAATPGCCHSCDVVYNNCLTYCSIYVKEDDYESCVAFVCEANYQICGQQCPVLPDEQPGCEHP